MVDLVAGSVVEVWGYVVEAVPGAWVRRREGAVGAWVGVPVAMMNSVLLVGETGDADVRELLDEVAGEGLPYSLTARPGFAEMGARVALGTGMVERPAVPLMVLRRGAVSLQRTGSVRRLGAGEAALHSHVASEGFGVALEVFQRLEGMFGREGVIGYVAEVGGEAAGTALAVRYGKFAGIFNVTTLERYRRRGVGAALTARAAVDAFGEGVDCAWLQSSPMGRRVYERLGFELLEEWPVWVAP